MPPPFEHDDEHEHDLVADLGVSFERSAFCASVVNFPRFAGAKRCHLVCLLPSELCGESPFRFLVIVEFAEFR